MSIVSNNRRVLSLDILRGCFILAMLLTHSIFFFHANSQPVLQILRAIGDFISFTGLLFISGVAAYIAYIHYRYPAFDVMERLSKRLNIYLVGYYLLAIWADSIITKNLSANSIWEIITFQRLVPFTEFIVPFLIFGILNIPLRYLYDRLSRSWLVTVIAMLAVYSLAAMVNFLKLSISPLSWKAILVGHPGFYSFPLLQYAPVYLLGIFIGRKFWLGLSEKKLVQIFLTIALISFTIIALLILISFTLVAQTSLLFIRWPPTPAFLLSGSGLAVLLLGVIIKTRNLKNFPWTRTALLILGQNTFAVLFTHTFLIYAYKGLDFPQVHGMLLFGVLTITSLILAVYLAKILPFNYRFGLTLIRWCECHFWYCSHANEHRLVRIIKALLWKITRVSDIFSFTVGRRRYRLVRGKSTLLAIVFVLGTVTPLGIAENKLIFKRTISAITGTLNHHWVLTTQSSKIINYEIVIPKDLLVGQKNVAVAYLIDDDKTGPMKAGNGKWFTRIDGSQLQIGKHKIESRVTINDSQYDTLPSIFYVSAPIFVTWTIDWEGYDVNDNYLKALEVIAGEHGIPMTHLFNPRIFTTDKISEKRVKYLTDWVKVRRDFKKEEIGLHLHMFPDFIEAAGIKPRTEQAWGGGFSPGYDILTTAYSYEEMKQILNYAKELFAQQGLGTPRSYRAGGWFANIETLKAIQDTGFLIDSSGRTKYTFGTKRIPGFWDLSSTTQPYFPSVENQNSYRPLPPLNILEIPNNGADSFAFSAEQMIKRFTDNYQGGVLTDAKQVTYLSHPHWFMSTRQQTMRRVFNYIDQWLNENDTGPVVYVTLSEVYDTWVNR